MTEDIDVYRRQTVCSNPGSMAAWLASAPSDLPSLRRLSTELVFHYWGNGNPVDHGFPAQRLAEIDLRYAEDQFARLAELTPGAPVETKREPTERILGCCRDFTLLLVSLLRERGVAARSRVGFAGYFDEGWWIDHVVAEVHIDGAWRLVEAQIPDGWSGVGGPMDPLDVPRDHLGEAGEPSGGCFLTGDAAWIGARAGRFDPERFVVSPSLDIPVTRGWTELAHHVVQDLAALTGWEAILWDTWGVLDREDPIAAARDPAVVAALDRAAEAIAGGAGLEELRRLAADPLFAVPPVVTSHSPLDGSERRVQLRAA